MLAFVSFCYLRNAPEPYICIRKPSNRTDMETKIYLLLADGFETIEALTPLDLLRRAKLDVETVAVGDDLTVTSSHGLMVLADTLISDCPLSDGRMLIIPGGCPGYDNLAQSAAVGRALTDFAAAGKLIAAICGGPTVLARNGVCRSRRIACHSSVVDALGDYVVTDAPVVRDGNLITADGAGHSLEFALEILGALTDADTVARVRRAMELD